jgi:hypothetical protein
MRPSWTHLTSIQEVCLKLNFNNSRINPARWSILLRSFIETFQARESDILSMISKKQKHLQNIKDGTIVVPQCTSMGLSLT